MRLIKCLIQLSLIIFVSSQNDWKQCIKDNPKPCPLQCQLSGYLFFMKQECQPPLWSTCFGQQSCDPTNENLYIKACVDYGYTLDEDGNCQPPDCMAQKNCLDIGTTYCIDQGFIQTKVKCDCITPKYVTNNRCINKIYSVKLQSLIGLICLFIYIILV